MVSVTGWFTMTGVEKDRPMTTGGCMVLALSWHLALRVYLAVAS